jgi:hypothetical protein
VIHSDDIRLSEYAHFDLLLFRAYVRMFACAHVLLQHVQRLLLL